MLLTTAYVAVSSENGRSAFRPFVFEPRLEVGATFVDRARKGDRLSPTKHANEAHDLYQPQRKIAPSLELKPTQNAPAATAQEPNILEGCDPAFSPLTASARGNFTARCLA